MLLVDLTQAPFPLLPRRRGLCVVQPLAFGVGPSPAFGDRPEHGVVIGADRRSFVFAQSPRLATEACQAGIDAQAEDPIRRSERQRQMGLQAAVVRAPAGPLRGGDGLADRCGQLQPRMGVEPNILALLDRTVYLIGDERADPGDRQTCGDGGRPQLEAAVVERDVSTGLRQQLGPGRWWQRRPIWDRVGDVPSRRGHRAPLAPGRGGRPRGGARRHRPRRGRTSPSTPPAGRVAAGGVAATGPMRTRGRDRSALPRRSA